MAGALRINAGQIAESTLRANGGFPVLLRLPGLAASGDDAEQLGLATPTFQDEVVGPAVWRKLGVDNALVLGAASVTALMGARDFASAEALFEAAAGVLVDGVLYTISDSEPVVCDGAPCGYRLRLLGPVRS